MVSRPVHWKARHFLFPTWIWPAPYLYIYLFIYLFSWKGLRGRGAAEPVAGIGGSYVSPMKTGHITLDEVGTEVAQMAKWANFC